MNAARRMSASDVFMWRVAHHAQKMAERFHIVNGRVRLRRTLTKPATTNATETSYGSTESRPTDFEFTTGACLSFL
jgi:hypothetical protein